MKKIEFYTHDKVGKENKPTDDKYILLFIRQKRYKIYRYDT